MSEELYRRIEKLEKSDSDTNKTLTQLVISTNRIADSVEKLNDLEPRVRKLEVETSTNRIVVNAVKWLAITVSSSAIGVVIISFSQGL